MRTKFLSQLKVAKNTFKLSCYQRVSGTKVEPLEMVKNEAEKKFQDYKLTSIALEEHF